MRSSLFALSAAIVAISALPITAQTPAPAAAAYKADPKFQAAMSDGRTLEKGKIKKLLKRAQDAKPALQASAQSAGH